MGFIRIQILGLILLLSGQFAFGQADLVHVDSIILKGHKRTKEKIILRELNFEVGDSLPLQDLQKYFTQSKSNLLNTSLFYTVDFNVKNWREDNHLDIEVILREAWFFYPAPIFDLADRNFNVWWKTFNGSLSRVNYGLNLQYLNLTGNNDPIELTLQFGFTPKYQLEYQLPYFDNKKNWRSKVKVRYSSNKDINYSITDNLENFTGRQEEVIFTRFETSFGVNYRPNFNVFHNFNVIYHNNTIQDTVRNLNPNFFLNNMNRQAYFELNYEFQYRDLDLALFPLSGFEFLFALDKDGIGVWDDIDSFEGSITFSKYTKFGSKFSLGNTLKGSYSFNRQQQPFNNYRALGSGDNFVRGYEIYAIDGLDFVFLKSALKFEIYNKPINISKFMPIEQFKYLPLRVYLSGHYDIGYVNDPYLDQENSFRNTILSGYGLGMDFVLYNTFAFGVEFSINHTGEKGLFLSNNVSF